MVEQFSKKAGPGDPAAPKTFCLPLLPSGPGGVHRVLLHRAQPFILTDILRRRDSVLVSLSPFINNRASCGLELAEGLRSPARLLQRGSLPHAPIKGTYPLQNPCSNPTLFIYCSVWRRGWDSNPRSRCRDACFPSMSIRPLSHLSASIEGRILACAPMSGKARLTSRMSFLILREEAAMKNFDRSVHRYCLGHRRSPLASVSRRSRLLSRPIQAPH